MITLQSRPQKQDKGNVGSGDEIDYPYGATLKGSFQEQRLWSLKVEVNHAPAILRCEKADIYNSSFYTRPHIKETFVKSESAINLSGQWNAYSH